MQVSRFENIDANLLSVTDSVPTGNATCGGLYVKGKSGSHTTHIVRLESSPNDIDWFTTSYTVSPSANLNAYEDIPICTPFIRGKVTTVEGGISTVDIYITLK